MPDITAVDRAEVMAPTMPPDRRLYERILQDAAADADMPAADEHPADPAVVKGLGLLIIAEVFRDVATYLTDCHAPPRVP